MWKGHDWCKVMLIMFKPSEMFYLDYNKDSKFFVVY